MPSPRKTEVNLPRADVVTRRYHEVVAPTSPPTEIFVGPVDKAEIQRLLKESADFREIILQISERTEFINATTETLRLISSSYGPGIPMSPADRDLVKESLADIRVELKSLYTAVSEPLAKVVQAEQGLEQQKQALERQQHAGLDVTAELAEVNTRLTQLANEKAVLEEFFKAFSGEDLDYAVRLANRVRGWREAEEKQKESQKNRERESQGRNAFETYLIGKGIPVVELQLQTRNRINQIDRKDPKVAEEEEKRIWKEYFDALTRYYISVLFNEVKRDITPQYLDVSNIAKIPQTIPGVPTQKDSIQFLDEMLKVPDGIEQTAAREILEVAHLNLIVFDIVFSQDEEYLKKIQDFKEIMNFFPDSGTQRNPWMWNQLFNSIGRLYWQDNEGVWHEESEAFGKKIYTALREIIRRGRNVDPATGQQRIFVHMKPEEDPHRSDVRAAQLMKADGSWGQYSVPVKQVPDSLPIVPFSQAIQGKSAETKMANFYEVVNDLTDPTIPGKESPRNPAAETNRGFVNRVQGADYRSSRGYHLDEIAMIFGVKLANITGESDFQDSPAEFNKDTKKYKPGSPEGRSKFAQAMNALRTVRKYIKIDSSGGVDGGESIEDVVGEINVAMTLEKAFWTYLDYFGYDGKTYTQHIIENEDPNKIVWGEVTSEKAAKFGLDASVIGQGMHPDKAQEMYGSMVTHFLPVVAEMWDPQFDLRELMTIDYNTGTVEKVNTAKISKLIGSLRKIVDYFANNEATPNAIAIERGRLAENPTGDMIAIEVRSSVNPGIFDPKVHRTVTRINQIFPMHRMNLWRWVPPQYRTPQQMDAGLANYYEETPSDDKGNNHGTRAETTWVFELPVENEEDMPTAQELIVREVVYRYLFALIYPGNQKASMDVSDWAILMSVLTDKGYEKMEQGWWDGPIAWRRRDWGKKLITGITRSPIVKSALRGLSAQVEQMGKDLFAKEIGSFSTRALYPWEMGFMLMVLLNDKIRLEEFTQVQGEIEQFLTAKKKK